MISIYLTVPLHKNYIKVFSLKQTDMVVWSGYGILVVPIVILCGLFSETLVEWLMNDDQYYQTAHLVRAGSLFYTAFFLFIIGIWLNRKEKGKHTFFFIPVEYWAFIILAISAWIVISEYLLN